MSLPSADPVVEFTQEKYKNVDMIVDVYAMQVVWSSENMAKMLEYTQDEIVNMSIRKILDLDPMQAMKIAITKFQNEPNQSSLITKTGKRILCGAEINSYLYNKAPYVAVLNVQFVNTEK
jgi:hypothetical protein